MVFGAPCAQCYLPWRETTAAADAPRCFAADLSNAQSAPCEEMIPCMTTNNCRVCVALPSGAFGLLRIEDADRLQARTPPLTACWRGPPPP